MRSTAAVESRSSQKAMGKSIFCNKFAANCRTEQRRCLVFRDKCINRPLPHESMRPLLNDISVTTRDQLTAFFDLNNAAARLERIINTTPQPEPDARVMGRRQLFSNLLKPYKR